MTDVKDIAHFSRIATNGIKLHVAEAGPVDGPPVFLLHGFPEFWYGWRNQIAPLAARAFHVIAPDQRGYNLSDKPKGIASYDLDQLAADVVGLANHFGLESFAVGGHDWGAAVGWWFGGTAGRSCAAACGAERPASRGLAGSNVSRSGAEAKERLRTTLSDSLPA